MKYLSLIVFLFLTVQLAGQKIDWDYFGQAVEYQKEKDFDQAIRIYSEMLQLDSNIYGCWKNRGQCLYARGQYRYALFDLYKAVNLSQHDSSLFFIIGLTHMSLEDWNKGIEFFNYAIDKGYPKGEEYYQSVGSCYLFLEQKDSAVKYLTLSYQINSASRTTLTNLAFSYIETQPEQSCKYFKEAYELDSLNSRSINNLGYSHYLCGNLENAYECYRKALKLEQTNSYIHRNIGLYYKAIGKHEEACNSLEKAVGLGFIADWGESDLKELMEYCQN